MAQVLEIGALNITASPHPPGIYRQLLTAVADKEVSIWGSDRAKITQPGPFEDHADWLYGQILIWAEIDTKGKWINKTKNKEATPEEKRKAVEALPADLEPNFRSFNFIFLEKKHRLVLEYRNELGQHFGPQRAEKFFERLFARHLPADSPTVDVTVIPEDDTLDKIYAIPRLRMLEIFLKRPNPDDVADEAQRILGRLEKQGARSQKLELTKAPKVKTLTPDAGTKKLAAVAAENGYVAGAGKDGDGKRIFESTQSHPKITQLPIEGDVSFATFLTGLRFFL